MSRLTFEQAVLRSNAILNYISQNDTSHSDVKEKLWIIPFFPVRTKPDNWTLRWQADMLPRETLLPPVDMYSPVDRNKVGSVGYIAMDMKDSKHFTILNKAIRFLQFKCVNLIDAVAQHEMIGKESLIFSKDLKIILKICIQN